MPNVFEAFVRFSNDYGIIVIVSIAGLFALGWLAKKLRLHLENRLQTQERFFEGVEFILNDDSYAEWHDMLRSMAQAACDDRLAGEAMIRFKSTPVSEYYKARHDDLVIENDETTTLVPVLMDGISIAMRRAPLLHKIIYCLIIHTPLIGIMLIGRHVIVRLARCISDSIMSVREDHTPGRSLGRGAA